MSLSFYCGAPGGAGAAAGAAGGSTCIAFGAGGADGAGVVVGVYGTTLLSTLFLASGSAVVEIMPYRFSHTLYARAPGAPVMYAAHSLANGDEYAALPHFASVAECLAVSRRCRAWYRSDERPLLFADTDATRVAALVSRGMDHVTEHIASRAPAHS